MLHLAAAEVDKAALALVRPTAPAGARAPESSSLQKELYLPSATLAVASQWRSCGKQRTFSGGETEPSESLAEIPPRRQSWV